MHPWCERNFFIAPLRGAPSAVDRIETGSGGKVFLSRRNPWRCGVLILTPWNPGRIIPLRGDTYVSAIFCWEWFPHGEALPRRECASCMADLAGDLRTWKPVKDGWPKREWNM